MKTELFDKNIFSTSGFSKTLITLQKYGYSKQDL